YSIEVEHYKALLPEYQRFLALIILGHRGLGMFSADVDKVWHSHILSTHLYYDFCIEFHGEFIHHVPQLVPKSDGKCSVCKSCKDCSIHCEQPDEARSNHDTLTYFRDAYIATFGEQPG